jgi:hypothetical protein
MRIAAQKAKNLAKKDKKVQDRLLIERQKAAEALAVAEAK